jgi:hypothetical protein
VNGPGISCPSDCSENYPLGTTVTLTAAPTGGSTFAGWSGDCTGATCTLTMNEPHSVAATFNAPVVLFPLTVTINGSGTGTVAGPGINCPGDCAESYVSGTTVMLTATPGGGSSLNWGGDCAGQTGPTCTVVMTAARNVIATFALATTTTLTLTVTATPPSVGFVSVTPPGKFGCNSAPAPGNTCTLTYAPTETVVLSPSASVGAFAGWGGACAVATIAGTNDCTLVMSVNRTVTAAFDVPLVPPAARQSTVVSRMDVAGARAQATMNEVPLAPPAPGVSTWTIEPRLGENRIEAQLLEGAGKAGTWRLELASVPSLERGSLRVLAGDVVSLGPDTVVFRLKGRSGERITLAFTAR